MINEFCSVIIGCVLLKNNVIWNVDFVYIVLL